LDSDRLLLLAERLAGREPVDWDEEIQSTSDGEERAVVNALRLLAKLSEQHAVARTPLQGAIRGATAVGKPRPVC